MPSGKEISDIERTFLISAREAKNIIRDFHAEMEKGLSGRMGSLKMLPAYAERTRAAKKGLFLALDLGGTNFRVSSVILSGREKVYHALSEKFTLQKKHISSSGKALFDFIARCVKKFVNRHKISRQACRIGFTFSFPIRQEKVDSGILVRWTKGFNARGVEGRDVAGLLNEALVRNGLPHIRVAAVTNDTVGTFLAANYKDKRCDVGVILGTGTNACYCEKLSKVKKYTGNPTPSGEMVINIEWGNFNRLRKTRFDEELDRNSANPKEQILEKMVSGMYMGEIIRLILRELVKKGVIFRKGYLSRFNKPDFFKTEYASVAEGDRTQLLGKTGKILRKIGLPASAEKDRRIVKKICEIVSRRAARISAIGVAAVVTKMDPGLSNKHIVAIDGSVYEKHPNFSKNMKSALKEIFGKKYRNIKLRLAKDTSGTGAAILAAANA